MLRAHRGPIPGSGKIRAAGLGHLGVAEGDDQVHHLCERADRPDVPVPGGGQVADRLVDRLRLIGPACYEQARRQPGLDDRDRRSGRHEVEEADRDLGRVAADDRQTHGEGICQARAGKVLKADREPPGRLRTLPRDREPADPERLRLEPVLTTDQHEPDVASGTVIAPITIHVRHLATQPVMPQHLHGHVATGPARQAIPHDVGLLQRLKVRGLCPLDHTRRACVIGVSGGSTPEL